MIADDANAAVTGVVNMCLDWLRLDPTDAEHWRLFAAAGLLLVGICSFATRGHLDAPNPNYGSGVGAALKPYAYQLFTTYLLPVQVMGFLLLAAMLGVIVLSRKLDAVEGTS